MNLFESPMHTPKLTYTLLLAGWLLDPEPSPAESEYKDVAVVVNTASPISVAIASYYKTARGIPDANIIRVTTSAEEEISGAEFDDLRHQIESYLTNSKLADSINYLVTTKGVPLKVCRSGAGTLFSTSASVESELTCILGKYSVQIAGEGGFASPYNNSTARFSRRTYGIYLVTRLDGYTLDEVKALINKSGPGLPVNIAGPYVLDKDPDWPSQYACLNNNISKAATALLSRNKQVIVNSDTVYLTRNSDIAGYVSWGSNDHHADDYTQHAVPHDTWAPGAIAETYVSTSGRTFSEPATYGQSLVADLIREGASGVKGYVYEPFLTAMADVSILFSRYTAGFNLAESYYSASRYLSWMDVIIGDPKTSYASDTAPLPIELTGFQALLSPGQSAVRISWTTASELDNYGFVIQRRAAGDGEFEDIPGSLQRGAGTTLSPQSYAWTDTLVPPGTYDYRLRQIDLDGASNYSEALRVRVVGIVASADESFRPLSAGLMQNYPNPFNPSTTINYQLSQAGKTRLVVYDALGRTVATLLDHDQGPGGHSITWNAGQIAGGVYFCRLDSGGRTWTMKMNLLK